MSYQSISLTPPTKPSNQPLQGWILGNFPISISGMTHLTPRKEGPAWKTQRLKSLRDQLLDFSKKKYIW